MELCHQLYDIIRNHKKDDGTSLCDSFIRVPKRRQEPSYYDVVSNPIDLLKVQQKLKTDEYEDLDDLQNDIELIVQNTKAFYKRNTQEYKDASELWELFLINKNKLLNVKEEDEIVHIKPHKQNRPGRPRKIRPEENQTVVNISNDDINNDEDSTNQYEELFQAVLSATDNDNKLLYTAFQLLPSKKRYPEYYEVIEQPIDLKLIATKIQNGIYSHLNELERDLLLMTKNACLFNEPTSTIYKNAKLLRKIIQAKKIEVENSRTTLNKCSERIRSKRLRGSAAIATLASITDDSDDNDLDNDDQIDDDDQSTDDIEENPQWKLFETVKTVTNNSGVPLSEPFWRLPSRRFYPDYYREIKNPVSLTQIRRKLMNRAYGTVSEVAGDLTIMFENAKKYNVATSKLYKVCYCYFDVEKILVFHFN